MFKRKLVFFIIFFFVAPLFFSRADAGKGPDNSGSDILIIQGVGYPPIKASSAAQARLMARRAAVLDAYRNALAAKGVKDYDENNLYVELQGFIKGMTIVQEEYLEDGGIRLRAELPAKDITVHSEVPSGKVRETGGPLPVTLEEWFTIIRKSVTITK